MSEFKVIKYKKSRKHRNSSHLECNSNISNDFLPLDFSKRLESAKEDISNSTFFKSFFLKLSEQTKQHQISEIVCYGIGRFSQCVTSRYQLAFLLLLRDQLQAKLFLFDPILSSQEISLSSELKFEVIKRNEEGKRLVDCDTLFFLPHCPKQLINNLLWRNWNNNLSRCIIVGNSFEKIIESHSNRFLEANLLFVFKSSSIVDETKIENSFKFTDIFNDLSIHTFEEEKLSLILSGTSSLEEPVYKEEDIEFVLSNLNLT